MHHPKPGNLCIKSKIWIENENGEIVFGAGRLYILKAVSRFGSINAAAQELHMSYRAVWEKSGLRKNDWAIPSCTARRAERREEDRR